MTKQEWEDRFLDIEKRLKALENPPKYTTTTTQPWVEVDGSGPYKKDWTYGT